MSSLHEEYFLGWNEHGNNFSLSFEELLQANKLVDVQLVAEGHLISAHRLVLSAMSPYFCNMFTQMPTNQQAFVFLQGISKQTMEGLMTYIYRGQVNVKQDCLDEFMNAAQSLNIKGLTDRSYSRSFDSRPSYATPAGPSYSGCAFQTPNFNQSFGSAGVQYQSVKRSADVTRQYQQSMKEYEQQNGFDLEDNNEMGGDSDSNYGQDYGEGSGSTGHSMNQHEVNSFDQWNNEFETMSNDSNRMETKKTVQKRVKRENDTSNYDIVADIQTNVRGFENLFYADKKFTKVQKPSAMGKQRWQCSKVVSRKCRAAMSTMEVNGIMKMKVLVDKHTHVD